VASRCIGARLDARSPVDVAEYEQAVLEMERSLTAADYEPDRSAPSGHYKRAYEGRGLLVLARVRDYYREYAWS
jgi:hypothetical protein